MWESNSFDWNTDELSMELGLTLQFPFFFFPVQGFQFLFNFCYHWKGIHFKAATLKLTLIYFQTNLFGAFGAVQLFGYRETIFQLLISNLASTDWVPCTWTSTFNSIDALQRFQLTRVALLFDNAQILGHGDFLY